MVLFALAGACVVTADQLTPAWMARRIVTVISGNTYRFKSEAQLHQALLSVFKREGIEVQHEYVAGPTDRFDFYTPDGVVVEVKIKGTYSQALRQVTRYLERDDVAHVVLATTRLWGRINVGETVYAKGKLLHVLSIAGQSF